MDWFAFSGRGSGMGEVPPACSFSYYLAYDIYKVAEVSDLALLLSVARAPHSGLSAVCPSTDGTAEQGPKVLCGHPEAFHTANEGTKMPPYQQQTLGDSGFSYAYYKRVSTLALSTAERVKEDPVRL